MRTVFLPVFGVMCYLLRQCDHRCVVGLGAEGDVEVNHSSLVHWGTRERQEYS